MISEKEYTIVQVARLMNVNRGTLYRWIKANVVKAKKVEGQYVINEKELKRLLGKL